MEMDRWMCRGGSKGCRWRGGSGGVEGEGGVEIDVERRWLRGGGGEEAVERWRWKWRGSGGGMEVKRWRGEEVDGWRWRGGG